MMKGLRHHAQVPRLPKRKLLRNPNGRWGWGGLTISSLWKIIAHTQRTLQDSLEVGAMYAACVGHTVSLWVQGLTICHRQTGPQRGCRKEHSPGVGSPEFKS